MCTGVVQCNVIGLQFDGILAGTVICVGFTVRFSRVVCDIPLCVFSVYLQFPICMRY